MILRWYLVAAMYLLSIPVLAAEKVDPAEKKGTAAKADADKGAKGKDVPDAASEDDPLNKKTLYQDPPYLELTQSELDDACRKYNGKHIAYYDDVYLVRDCKLFRIDDAYAAMKKGVTFVEVDSRTVDALRYGGKVPGDVRPPLDCAQLERKYVTISFVEVFWIEKCKKRLFPDWASFETHRGRLELNRNVVWLTGDEIANISSGPDMPSVVPAEYRSLLQIDAPIEVIPLEEACRGLIGKYVSYLDEVYFIQTIVGANYTAQHCQKRKVDGEEFTRKSVNAKFTLTELTSTQALSIPTGKVIESEKRKDKDGNDRG